MFTPLEITKTKNKNKKNKSLTGLRKFFCFAPAVAKRTPGGNAPKESTASYGVNWAGLSPAERQSKVKVRPRRKSFGFLRGKIFVKKVRILTKRYRQLGKCKFEEVSSRCETCREASFFHLRNPELRCILKIARMEFARRASRDSGNGGGE